MHMFNRGGGGGGKSWHNAGKGSQKLNSIYDFIACSKYLCEEGYVHKKLLGATGNSAGGLLIAAAVNMCPDLYRAIVLKVSFRKMTNKDEMNRKFFTCLWQQRFINARYYRCPGLIVTSEASWYVTMYVLSLLDSTTHLYYRLAGNCIYVHYF